MGRLAQIRVGNCQKSAKGGHALSHKCESTVMSSCFISRITSDTIFFTNSCNAVSSASENSATRIEFHSRASSTITGSISRPFSRQEDPVCPAVGFVWNAAHVSFPLEFVNGTEDRCVIEKQSPRDRFLGQAVFAEER